MIHHFWKLCGGLLFSASAALILATAAPAVSAAEAPPIATATGTTALVPTGTPGWSVEADGTIRYYLENAAAATGTVEIDGVLYLFSSDGILQTGWQEVSGAQYYYDSKTGKSQFGWVTVGDKRYYILEDTGKQTGWLTLDDKQYYLDEDGILQTGFFQTELFGEVYYAGETGAIYRDGVFEINGTPYCFHPDGTERTGWQTVDGIRRFYNPNTGEAEYGWVVWNDRYYYVSRESGKYLGAQEAEGKYYPFSAEYGYIEEGFCTLPDSNITRYYYKDGSLHTGWLEQSGGKVYYFDADGTMVTGWQTVDDKRYYFHENGLRCTGIAEIDGKLYGFDTSGILQTGLCKHNDKLYYFDPDTGAAVTGLLTLPQGTYYFQEDGSARMGWLILDDGRYYFDTNGLRCTGWQTIDGKRYCFDGNGKSITGWQTDANGVRYYFGADGAMLTGLQTISGNTYYFAENGGMCTGKIALNGKNYYFDTKTGALLRNQTQNGYTTNADGVIVKVLLNTPYLSQAGYPTGCESASAVMLLRHAGYSTSIDTFIDTALDIGYLYYGSDGYLHGPDPNSAFIGDPRSTYGYGCYAPVIANALNRIVTPSKHTVKNITGTSMKTLLTDYIDNGTAVAVWATINMMAPESGTQWILPNGQLYTWTSHEHCLVLVGYDDKYYYMNDPYNSNGLRAYERSVVEARYAALGYQAVAITSI